MKIGFRIALASLLLVAACNNKKGGTDSGPAGSDSGPASSDSGPASSDSGTTGSDSGPASSDSGTTADGSSGATVTLTVNNYLSWCSVKVNGGMASTALTQTVTLPAGTVVPLHAQTADSSMFMWGYWVGTDGDTSASHDTGMDAMVTVTADTTVTACCPDNGVATCPGVG